MRRGSNAQIALLGFGFFVSSIASWFIIAGSVVGFAARGHAAWVDGVFSAIVWIVTMLTALVVGRLAGLAGAGMLMAVALGARLCGIAGFLSSQDDIVWILGAAANGFATGVLWVLGESILAEVVPSDRRGRIMGIIETLVGGAGFFGGAAATVLSDRLYALFWMSALLMGIATLCYLAAGGRAMHAQAPVHSHGVGADGMWISLMPLLLICFASGLFESGSTGMLPIFAIQLGLGAALAASTVALIGAGSLLGQFPLGWLSDHAGVRRVVLGALGSMLLATPMLVFVPHGSPGAQAWLLWIVGFVWGFSGGSLYTLSIIQIGHQFQGPHLIQGMGMMVVVYTLGASVGPIAGSATFTLGGMQAVGWTTTVGIAAVMTHYWRYGGVPLRR